MGGATSRVYGILPFGLRHSGAPICQNRITGDPRTPSGRYILGLSVPYRTGPPARIPSHRRKTSGTSQHVDDRTCGCRTTVSCARRSRPGPVESPESSVAVSAAVSGMSSPCGELVPRCDLAPIGLVVSAVRPVRRFFTPLIRGSGRVCGAPVAHDPCVSAIGPCAVPAHPSPGVVDPQTMHT
ncbi:hypothetical protein FSY75_19335 [Streptomyces sp. TR1341]|nr:hypothetical protein [Streptomyces sp. TR1341]